MTLGRTKINVTEMSPQRRKVVERYWKVARLDLYDQRPAKYSFYLVRSMLSRLRKYSP